MKAYKQPLIGSTEHRRPPGRTLEPYRPFSTRPWVLFLFLSATGACFALLVVVSLIEKTTSLNQKRDILYARDLFHVRRQTTTTISDFTSVSSAYLQAGSATAPSPNILTSNAAVATSKYLAASSTPLESLETSVASAYLAPASSTHTVTPQVTSSVAGSYLAPASNTYTSTPTATSTPTSTSTSTTTSAYSSISSSTFTSSSTSISTTTQSPTSVCYVTGTVTVFGTSSTVTQLDPAGSECSTVWITTVASAYLHTGTTTPPSAQSTCVITATVTVFGDNSGVTDVPSVPGDCSTVWVTITTSGSYLYGGSTSSLPQQSASDYTTTNTGYLSPGSIGSPAAQTTTVFSTPGFVSTATDTAYLSPNYPSADPSTPNPAESASASSNFYPYLNTGSTSYLPAAVSQTTITASYLSSASSYLATDTASYLSSASSYLATNTASYLSFSNTGPSSDFPPSSAASAVSYLSFQGTGSTPVFETASTSAPDSMLNSASPSQTTYFSESAMLSTDSISVTEPSPTSSNFLSNLYNPTSASSSPTTSSGLTPVAQSSANRIGTVFIVTTTTSTSTASLVAPTSGSSNDTIDPTLGENLVLIKMRFHMYDYFLALYLPKIVAVLMSSLWSIVFAGLRLMEPFFQLSQPSGAFARDALFGAYLSSELTPSSLSAMLRGQWVLILGSLVMIGWAAIIALISEAMMIIGTEHCHNPDGKPYRCAPGWVVNKPVLDVCIAILGFIFVLTFIIMWMLSLRRHTGIFSNPSSIAAMSELLGNPAVLWDFREVNAAASEREVKHVLGENRYKIGWYDAKSGNPVMPYAQRPEESRWGLMKIAPDPMRSALNPGTYHGYDAVSNPDGGIIVSTNHRRRAFQMAYDTVMLLTALTIFALVLGYYLDAGSDPLNNFFNDNSFGPHIVLTGLALILSFGWKRTAQEVALMAPYRSMATQADTGAPAHLSVLAPTACTVFTAIYKGFALRNSMILVAAVPAILSEILLIAVSNVPFSASEMLVSLRVCAFTSLAIVGIMAICSIIVIIYNRRSAGGTRRLPRSPDTPIGVWLYLCGSSLTRPELHEPSQPTLTSAELVLKYKGRHYNFTNSIGVDNRIRWTVDDVGESVGRQAARPPDVQRQSPASPLSGYTQSMYSEATSYEAIRQQHHEHRNQPPAELRSIDSVISSNRRQRQQHAQQIEQTQLLHRRQTGDFMPRSFVIVPEEEAPNPNQPARFESMRPKKYSMSQDHGAPSDYHVPRAQQYSTMDQNVVEQHDFAYVAPEVVPRSGIVGAESPLRTRPQPRFRDPYSYTPYQGSHGTGGG